MKCNSTKIPVLLSWKMLETNFNRTDNFIFSPMYICSYNCTWEKHIIKYIFSFTPVNNNSNYIFWVTFLSCVKIITDSFSWESNECCLWLIMLNYMHKHNLTVDASFEINDSTSASSYSPYQVALIIMSVHITVSHVQHFALTKSMTVRLVAHVWLSGFLLLGYPDSYILQPQVSRKIVGRITF